MADFTRAHLLEQAKQAYADLEKKGYDTSWWDPEDAVDMAIKQFEENGSKIAEIHYDGPKYFYMYAY